MAGGLAHEVRRTGLPFRTVVNDALRRGLEAAPAALPGYRVEARPMGLRAGIEIDDIAGLLDRLDGPAAP